MIQFNLLPDIKLAYVKAERQKRIVMTVSLVVGAAAIAVFILLFLYANVVQKKSISDLTADIKTSNTDLTKTKDINKILTIQNQLGALEDLHNNTVAGSRVYDYIQQITPKELSLTNLETDFDANTMVITGKSKTLAAVNTYADGLKFTKFTTKNDNGSQKTAFNKVVLASFSVDDKDALTYTLNVDFDPVLFSRGEEVIVITPQMITTRSATEKPGAVFQQPGGGQ